MSSPETIPLVNLGAQYQRYRDQLEPALQTIFSTGAFIGGKAVAEFEASFANYCGTQHAVGVGNGTDALHLALRGLELSQGFEVLVPANTFIASAEAVSLAGGIPVFVDVDPKTALMDLRAAEKRLSPQCKVIMPVHLYGRMAPMDEFMAFAEAHGLKVLEDAAQAQGAQYSGQRAGSAGYAGCFSFYPGKNLGAYGDAGAVVTNDAELATKIRCLANHGRSEKYGHEFEGLNSRLDGVQAAVLNVKLQHLDTWNQTRQKLSQRYQELLEDIPGLEVMQLGPAGSHVVHIQSIWLAQSELRDRLRAHLQQHKISSGLHYPIPLPLLTAYAHQGHQKGDFPVAESMAQRQLSLPMCPELTLSQCETICAEIRRFMEAHS